MKLYWNVDSPYSRALKWLLLQHRVAHEDRLLAWDELPSDPALGLLNPKRQIPTLDIDGSGRTDALLIALDYLPAGWHRTLDAKLFRIADADMEAVVIFLFRARLLERKFGPSAQAEFMRESGSARYRSICDVALDHYLRDGLAEIGVGAVLLHSFLLSAAAIEPGIRNYRGAAIAAFCAQVEADAAFQRLAAAIAGAASEVGAQWQALAN